MNRYYWKYTIPEIPCRYWLPQLKFSASAWKIQVKYVNVRVKAWMNWHETILNWAWIYEAVMWPRIIQEFSLKLKRPHLVPFFRSHSGGFPWIFLECRCAAAQGRQFKGATIFGIVWIDEEAVLVWRYDRSIVKFIWEIHNWVLST